jgi:hypothetical protein
LALRRKHIERAGDRYRTKAADVGRNQITHYPDGFDPMALLIIDGKPITCEAFGRRVAEDLGFRFKLEMFDRSEER